MKPTPRKSRAKNSRGGAGGKRVTQAGRCCRAARPASARALPADRPGRRPSARTPPQAQRGGSVPGGRAAGALRAGMSAGATRAGRGRPARPGNWSYARPGRSQEGPDAQAIVQKPSEGPQIPRRHTKP